MAAPSTAPVRTPPDPDDCTVTVLFGHRYAAERLALIAGKIGTPVIAVPVSVAKAADSGLTLGLHPEETEVTLAGHDPSDKLEEIAASIRAEVPGADVDVHRFKEDYDVGRYLVKKRPMHDVHGGEVFSEHRKPPDPLGGFTLRTADWYDDAKPDEFLCDGLQAGALNVHCGPSGSGKSNLELKRGSCLTTGAAEPLFGLEAGPPRDVIIISNEMSRAAVNTALRAFGADMQRVHIVEGDQYQAGESEDEYLARRGKSVQWLRRELAPSGLFGDLDVGLILVDMFSRELPPGTKMSDPVAATQALLPWKSLAETTGAAVQLVMHPNRTKADSLMDRISLSSEIGKLARCITWTSRVDESEYAHGILLANGAQTTPARRFRMKIHEVHTKLGGTTTAAEPVYLSHDEDVIEEVVLNAEAARESKRRGPTTAVTDRQDRLVELVRSKPGRPASFYVEQMQERFRDTSRRTIDGDRNSAGIITAKAGFGGASHWYPPETPEDLRVPVEVQDDDRPHNPFRLVSSES